MQPPAVPLTSPYGQQLLAYLPPYYQTSQVLAAVLQAEGAQFDLLYGALGDLLNQWFAATATWQLTTWETILALPPNPGLTDAQRQARLISQLSANGTATLPKVIALAAGYNDGQISVVEDFPHYSVIVTFISLAGTPSNVTDLQAALRALVPAHLQLSYVYLYLTWDKLDSYHWTWDALDALGLTWDQLQTHVV